MDIRATMERVDNWLSEIPKDEVPLLGRKTRFKCWCDLTVAEKHAVMAFYSPMLSRFAHYPLMTARSAQYHIWAVPPDRLRAVLERMVRKGLLQRIDVENVPPRRRCPTKERVYYGVSDRLKKALHQQGFRGLVHTVRDESS